jgi:hypothetical protein
VRDKLQAETTAASAILGERVKALQVIEKELTAETERVQAQAQTLRQAAENGEALRADIAQAEATLQKVAAERAALESQAPPPSRVTLLERAEAPRGK